MTAPTESSRGQARSCSDCGGTCASDGTCDCRRDGLDAELLRRLAEALGPQYVVVGRLAQGGFSEVLECCDIELDRRLAVKVLRPDIAWTHGMRARFKQEARAIARLNHPNIVPIHFVGESDGLVYYVMPYVQGPTLADRLVTEGRLDARALVPALLPVLDALEHAHEAGIVHRDIKPDNVLLEAGSGRPLLVDFGIAKCLTGASHQTQAGFVVGTPLYMSPEQALGRDTVDARSDVYAFGAMVFQLVTGEPPFDGPTSQEIVGKHLADPVPVPAERQRSIPEWFSDVVVRCLAKNPAHRFASAGEVAEALRAGLRTEASPDVAVATPVSPLPRPAAASPLVRFELETAAPTYAPDLVLPEAPPAPRRPGRMRYLVGTLTVAAAVAVVLLRPATPATVLVRNRLLHPVWLTVQGGRNQLIAAGDSLRFDWAAGERLAAEWSLVRPVSPSGRPMGEELRGELRIDDPRGNVARTIDVQATAHRVFTPRVTNASGGALRLVVDQGDGTPLCDCEVPAAAAAASMGYYRLGERTAVQLRDDRGREVRYDLLDPIRERSTGAVALRVESAQLNPTRDPVTVSLPRPVAPVRPAARLVRASTDTRRQALGATASPVATPPAPAITAASPEVEESRTPDPLPLPTDDAPAPAPSRRGRNPAAGFLPMN